MLPFSHAKRLCGNCSLQPQHSDSDYVILNSTWNFAFGKLRCIFCRWIVTPLEFVHRFNIRTTLSCLCSVTFWFQRSAADSRILVAREMRREQKIMRSEWGRRFFAFAPISAQPSGKRLSPSLSSAENPTETLATQVKTPMMFRSCFQEIGRQSTSLLGSLHLLGNLSSLQDEIAGGLADLRETGDYMGFVRHVRGGLAESYNKVLFLLKLVGTFGSPVTIKAATNFSLIFQTGNKNQRPCNTFPGKKQNKKTTRPTTTKETERSDK